MKLGDYIVCPICKGKGHVIDPMVMTFVPIVSWAIAALEKDDRNSTTRKPCGNCKGRGFIRVK